MYSDNNYVNLNRKKRRQSNAPVIIILIIFIILTILASLYIYDKINIKFDEYNIKISNYENVLNEYESVLDDYESILNNYRGRLNELDTALSSLSGNLTDGLTDVNDLRDSLEQVSNSPVFTDNNNSRSINIVDTAARVSPSVIGIKVHVPARNTNNFWRTRAMESEGSGIILTEDGYIITNYHVVAFADQYANTVISVILDNGSEYIADYIGGDELNDLAVLKIDANNLPYAVLGSSDDSQVGDFVIAIGNPLGVYLSGSVTFGIISGLNRRIQAANIAENLIQTDAAINPGNSGGALLNLNGEVIGINTIKVARSGGGVNVEGIGFAIPIDFAKPLIDSIIQHGYVKGRPTIGLSGSSISNSIALIYRVPVGLLVESLDSDGGAAAVGIREGDIITQIDGISISGMNEIANIIRSHEVGDTVKVTLWRDNNYYEAQIILTEQK